MDQELGIENKGLRKIVILLLALLIIFALVFFAYFFVKVNRPTSSQSRPTTFAVDRGMNTTSVANKLKQERIINNSWVFVLYVNWKGASNKIQAGQYLLDPKMSIAEIVDALTAGKVISNERRVTIIEGWTNQQIGERLGQPEAFAAVLSSGNFDFKFSDIAKPFEYQGFVFPDTYLIDSSENELVDFVNKALKNFENKLSEQMLEDLESKNLKLADVIILASIIEKEVGRNKETISDQDRETMQKERELVAAVFYNRLAAGIPLQSDATVNYVTGKSDRQPLIEDTQIKSPYNTYQVAGLPPGPIGNPGLNSIKAAIYPANSDYLYFLNKIDGEAVFARTIEEHNANRAKYLD